MYYTDLQVAELFGCSRHTIWRWVREGYFPAPVRLGPGCTRWRVDEVKEWDAARVAERQPARAARR